MTNRELIYALMERDPGEQCRVRVSAQHGEIDLDILDVRRINDACEGHTNPHTIIKTEEILIKAQFSLET